MAELPLTYLFDTMIVMSYSGGILTESIIAGLVSLHTKMNSRAKMLCQFFNNL